MDGALPGGRLVLGALHDMAGNDGDAVHAVAAARFAAGISARTQDQVLWIASCADVFGPGLQHPGLSSERIIFLEANREVDVLACFEEGLRHGSLGAVVAEIDRLSLTTSRRLQLAAEASGVPGLAVRRGKMSLLPGILVSQRRL